MKKHSEREMHSFPASGVILKDPVFRHRQELVRKYLAEFDLERLMYSFRKNAGMESDAEPLEGWDYLLGNMAEGNDVLSDLHANTHLPMITGALHRYAVTGEETYRKAGVNFYRMIRPRTFANGNSSSRAEHFLRGGVSEQAEHWGANRLDRTYLTGGESESCCAHNTEKILEYLLRYDPEHRLQYLEHLESLKYNAVLNAFSGKTGLSQYHQPMGADSRKKFSSPYGDFWCCTGSGVEAAAELQKNIWFEEKGRIFLNMFVSSELHLEEPKATLCLQSEFPKKPGACLQVETDQAVSLELAFRQSGVKNVQAHGAVCETSCEDGFLVVTGTFGEGSFLELELQAEIREVPLTPEPASSRGIYRKIDEKQKKKRGGRNEMLHGTARASGEILEWYEKDGSYYLKSEAGILRIRPLTGQSVRVSWTENGSFSGTQGAELEIPKRPEAAEKEWELCEEEKKIRIRSSRLCICVEKSTGRLVFEKADGTILLSEAPKGARRMEAYQTGTLLEGQEEAVETVQTADGAKKVLRHARRKMDRTLYGTHNGFEFSEEECLYGLGQHQQGVLNLRGTMQYLHQANQKIAVPMLLSSKGYGILLTTQGAAVFHDDSFGSYFRTEGDEMLDYCFLSGETMEEAAAENRRLTGKAVMLPKWAFGYLQSKERYETAEEIEQTVQKFRDSGFPLDGIILDWQSWEGDLWGQKTFDARRFPDPAGMVRRIGEKGVHFMMSIWPNMSRACENFREFEQRGLLLPGTEIYDAFSEEGRALYAKQLEEGLGCHGVNAWWCDSSEPVTPEWNHKEEPEPSRMYQEYVEEAGSCMPMDRINAYGLYHAKAIYESQRNKSGETRVMNLTRSGYTGSQKYGTVLWSGDISASWETLRRQITAGLSLSASGLPYWTVDIGAFFVTEGNVWFWNGEYPEGTADPAYRELYVRWFQFGAFLPVFRSHGTEFAREPWEFGALGEPYYDALKKMCEERYRLLPYLYSAAWQVYKEDRTMLRLLAFDFPEDRTACELKDEYLLGDSLLVCPVTEPMEENGKAERERKETEDPKAADPCFRRRVYLPGTIGWYDYWTGKRYEGGQWIFSDAPLEKFPLFVKEGTLLPTMEPNVCTRRMEGMPVTVKIYPGKDGTAVLYEDAGDGYGYETGEFCETRLVWNEREQKVSCETTGDLRWRKGDIGFEIVRERRI